MASKYPIYSEILLQPIKLTSILLLNCKEFKIKVFYLGSIFDFGVKFISTKLISALF